MKSKNKVLFYGYSDGKALHIHNLINFMVPIILTLIPVIILTVLSIVIREYYVLFVWIIPGILLLAAFLDFYMIKYNDKQFLKNTKKKHAYNIENNNFLKNGKGINANGLKIYVFRKYIFIEFWKSFCRVPNEEFIDITRDEFLSLFTINKITHSAKFVKKYKCPCCGHYTLDYLGMYDICPVCFWEDNNEVDSPDEYDDCNKMTLNEARKNYLKFGSCKKDMIKYCRT